MYTPPSVVSNVVLFQYSDGNLFITLIADPSPNSQWHLPGTAVSRTQTSLSSLDHTLHNAIGLDNADITYREQLYTSEFAVGSHSTVCISYLYLSRDIRWRKSTQQIGVFSIDKLPSLSESDMSIIRYASARLHAKALYSTILSFLLPRVFDLAQLQQAFETITGQTVDKRNFRKKITQLDVLKPMTKDTVKKDPVLYSFKNSGLDFLSKPFPPKKTVSRQARKA